VTAVRVLAGVGSVVFGLYLGGANATAYEAEWNVAVFSVIVIIAGMVLIAQARRRPRTSRAGRIAGTAVGAAGLLAGVVTPVQQTCCDAVGTVSLGLPLPWTTGHGDTWSQAVGDALRGIWDPLSAISNAIFWAYTGMLVAVVIGLIRGAEPETQPRARHFQP
jgi:disulfide bond formation protein DsbB